VKLFIRILAALWIIILFVIATVTLVPSLSLPIDNERLREIPLVSLQICAQDAVNRYLNLGSQALHQEVPNCHQLRLVAPGPNPVRDLTGQPLTHEETMLVLSAFQRSGTAIKALPDSTVVASRADPASADSYIFITSIPVSHRAYALWTLGRVLRAVVVSGLFSLLITAYVARPITSLTGVAEQFGAGDLKARVVSSTIRRKDELGDLARVFNQMAARTESLVERYKSFLAHVSHELGSPLARLNIALALARRRAGTQLQAEHDRIGHEAERLSSLVQELLLLARLESGNELSRNSSRFNATKLVEEACEDARLEADQEHKVVQICRAEQFDVEGHPDLLRRALDNVLRNGLKFTQPDGCVEVSCFRKDAATAVIQIQDDGPGILPGQEELIFEPFVTLPGNGDKRGSGLGLAISRQAIFANGGKIYAQCLPGKGLTVTIELPIASTKTQPASKVEALSPLRDEDSSL
jgi:two-component system sensor histidine kinase CpxA